MVTKEYLIEDSLNSKMKLYLKFMFIFLKIESFIVRTYTIEVTTGDKNGSGTDANVFINIHGEKGSSYERQLFKSLNYYNKFERNQVLI